MALQKRILPPMDRRGRWVLAAAVIGSGMVFLDSTVVTVALPRMGAELPTTYMGVLEAQSYVYNGYLLSLSALLLIAGALNDAKGRRRMFVIGLIAFAVTSVMCGLAPTMETLIAFRVLQGAAGAILVPGALSILTAEFTGEERGRAFGVWAAASGITTIVGPLVGGVLVDTVTWRAVFFLNVPLAAVGVWATLRYVNESRDEDAPDRMDWTGAGLAALALGGLAFGAIRGQEQAWQDPVAFAALALGLAAAAILPWWLRIARQPLCPPRLFQYRNFTVTNVSTMLIYGALYVTVYLAVVFLQGTIGYNAAAAGAATIPAVVFLSVLSPRFGTLAARHGPRWYMAAGPAVSALGVLWLVRVSATTPPWTLVLSDPGTWVPPSGYLIDILPGLLVFGAGLSVVVAPLTTALMNSVPVRHAGVASAVNNAISRVGPQLVLAVLFVAVAGTFYTGVVERVPDADPVAVRATLDPLNPPPAETPPELATAAREASTESFRLAMVVAAGLLLAGAAVNAVGIRNDQFVGLAAGQSPPSASA
jgi:EmrB/QacA subfamily drug resistance transporter